MAERLDRQQAEAAKDGGGKGKEMGVASSGLGSRLATLGAAAPSSASTSALRARLRSEGPRAEPKRGTCPEEPDYIGPGCVKEMTQEMRAMFALEGSSKKAFKVSKRPKKEHGAVTKLKVAFAESGLGMYMTWAKRITAAYRDLSSRIEHLSGESRAFVSKSEPLYSHITYPLSATVCHSETVPKANMGTHLSKLRSGLCAGMKEMDELQREWEETVAEVREVWAELVDAYSYDDGATFDVEGELAGMREEIDKITQSHEEKLEEIEAKYEAEMQAETLKIVRSLG